MNENTIVDYLSRWEQRPLQITEIKPLGDSATGAAALKAFGYGKPLRITYQVGGEQKQVVLRQVQRNGFGREYDSDRVAEVWRDYHNFNLLSQHIKALDIILKDSRGYMQSIGQAEDLLLLTNYAPGRPYANDLLRIRDEGQGSAQDIERTRRLAIYLAGIHRQKHDDPLVWRRRLRDLVGHGEGIMGLTDSYPDDETVISARNLRAIEEAANRWRWQLKPRVHRLSQVHGDYHPFNILFTEDNNFTLIDRSRGEWGEPADDVSCLSINYLFFALQRDDSLTAPFQELYTTFWETYLERSQDQELLSVIAPWLAWRALVLASPQWYPSLSMATRHKLLNFASNVMADTAFNWEQINDYLEAP